MAYEYHIRREGDWWMIDIPELGGLTQAKSLGEAVDMVREYIAVTQDIPTHDVDIHLKD